MANFMKKALATILTLVMVLSVCVVSASYSDKTMVAEAGSTGHVITTPPTWLDNMYGSEWRGFYKKCVYVYGLPIVSTYDVPDEALYKAYDVLEIYLRKMAASPTYSDIITQMIANQCNIVIIGEHEYNVQHPSWHWYLDPNSTERMGGGSIETTVLVEDLIVPSNDWWRGEFAGLVHEFSHSCFGFGIGDYDRDLTHPEIARRIINAYNDAKNSGKYKESDYDLTNAHEYWCGQVGRWFNGSPTNLNVANAANLTDKEQLAIYDPTVYQICSELFGAYTLPTPWGTGADNDVPAGPASSTTTKKTTTKATTTKATTTKTAQSGSNLARNASVSTSYCSSWETLTAVNDGLCANVTYDTSGNFNHYGSWGNGNAASETITYTWSNAVTIGSTGIFFWTDGGGILLPASYSFQYLNNGNWVNVPNASGLAVGTDRMNVTTFTPVTTTGLRVTLNKQAADGNGVGVTEWEVYGATAPTTTTTKKTTTTTKTTTTKKTTTTTKATTAQSGTNLALNAGVSTSYCSSWETLGAVNDGRCAAVTFDTSGNFNHYGSWGNGNAASETITYTWNNAVTIGSTGIFFWTDGSGILLPASYSFQYLNNGNWVNVPNASGLVVGTDRMNITTFTPVTTTALRVTLNKQAADGNGVGVTEWEVYGGTATTTKKTTTTAPFVSTNAALSANVSTSYCSSWETLGAVNDGRCATVTYDTSGNFNHYGSWGNGTSASETITYTWNNAVKIGSTGIFFWTDGDGILLPASYSIQYLSNGNWVNVKNASGLAVGTDRMNITTFTPVTTTGLRITLNKQAADYNGVGVTEWEVYTAA